MQVTAACKKLDYRKYTKNIEKFVVLAAWIAIYVGLYMVTKDSALNHPMKAHSVDRMGLLPPYGVELNELNPQNHKEDADNVR